MHCPHNEFADRGSFFTSRLANLHAERFLGFAFVTMGYTAPYPDVSLEEKVKEASERLGYSVFGYFPLLGYQEKLIEEHVRRNAASRVV